MRISRYIKKNANRRVPCCIQFWNKLGTQVPNTRSIKTTTIHIIQFQNSIRTVKIKFLVKGMNFWIIYQIRILRETSSGQTIVPKVRELHDHCSNIIMERTGSAKLQRRCKLNGSHQWYSKCGLSVRGVYRNLSRGPYPYNIYCIKLIKVLTI